MLCVGGPSVPLLLHDKPEQYRNNKNVSSVLDGDVTIGEDKVDPFPGKIFGRGLALDFASRGVWHCVQTH